MATNQKWVIEKSGEKFIFTRLIDDKAIESYAPVSQGTACICAVAILQNDQLPPCLICLDKHVG